MGKRFAVIGVGGFVAPRHLKAIQDVGGEIVCALDPKDSVGVLDSYSKDVEFFTEFERFDRYCEKLRMEGNPIDYVSICSPNYLHDAHCRFAMRIGATPICEKPLVIAPHNLTALETLEQQFGITIRPILQLRYNPNLKVLKENLFTVNTHNVDLKYYTPRGKWYWQSWKGNKEKSGGLLLNIGIHFVDVLLWLFGGLSAINIKHGEDTIKFELFNAGVHIHCDFSINPDLESVRKLVVDGNPVDMTAGFTDLHTECYRDIVNGGGLTIADVRSSLKLVNYISG